MTEEMAIDAGALLSTATFVPADRLTGGEYGAIHSRHGINPARRSRPRGAAQGRR